MSKLTGNKDADFLILMKLNDKELSLVCQANKYVNSLCKDDRFWLNRILLNFPDYSSTLARDMKNYLEFDSWKEFYIWLKSQYPSVPNKIIKSLDQDKKAAIDETLQRFKKIKLHKWINPVEFYKVFKRYAFINAQEDVNEDYTEPVWDESLISRIEWKTYHSIADDNLLKLFQDEWMKVFDRFSE